MSHNLPHPAALPPTSEQAGNGDLVPGFPTEAIAFLGISRQPGVGFHTMRVIGSRQNIADLLETRNPKHVWKELYGAGAKSLSTTHFDSWEDLRRELWNTGLQAAKNLAQLGIRLLFSDDRDFPPSLRQLPEAERPHWIFVQGDVGLLHRPSIAVVGTRSPTEDGEFLAKYVVSVARELGLPVVSGLAKGIDKVAHEWCLHLDLPTISVLGTGILVAYPARHADLGKRIVENGGILVSEYLPDQPPSKEQFVWRNRIQAALSACVIPVEWKRDSGTAHTVRFARLFDRPVCSIQLNEVPLPSDAGHGDSHFHLPRDQSAFVRAVRAAVERQLAGPQIQHKLFE